ncbi:D-alanyl-D-alanine carboxypeptidase family protein [Neobacillus mesonae]|uniref:M15 family metallopeptidase n=1 Tax=Neobacillus mesonae TaxID=1193713 RepID=UPI00203FE8A3|nr:M15 family metallopeptidase [Neobacillus mesonae]MCM3567369.1 M15 family metallopeptidase [Neobacillus mesonae]
MKKIYSVLILLILLGGFWGAGWVKKQLTPEEENPAVPVNKLEKTQSDSINMTSNPKIIPVLVNKQHKLPENYAPADLVEPSIEFIFQEKSEKRKMRSEAAAAIEQLFAGASEDGVKLLGVSAYRSHATQEALFQSYVKKDGYETAQTYSALPGTSEHETGLAIDVTGGDGKCAAADCFAGSTEANWLENHAADYGFIIRYPKGKEEITGYQYEPWHLRYVGKKAAADIAGQGITLEEYDNSVPVNTK